MQQFQALLGTALDKLGFLSNDQKLSLTNVAVMLFVSITAFRSLFGNANITVNHYVNWTVQPIDIASTLPMLFALLNYANKRMTNNQQTKENTPNDKSNS